MNMNVNMLYEMFAAKDMRSRAAVQNLVLALQNRWTQFNHTSMLLVVDSPTIEVLNTQPLSIYGGYGWRLKRGFKSKIRRVWREIVGGSLTNYGYEPVFPNESRQRQHIDLELFHGEYGCHHAVARAGYDPLRDTVFLHDPRIIIQRPQVLDKILEEANTPV
jgi:hypothetical protein